MAIDDMDWAMHGVTSMDASPCMNTLPSRKGNKPSCDLYMARLKDSDGSVLLEIPMPFDVMNSYSSEVYELEAVDTQSHTYCVRCENYELGIK